MFGMGMSEILIICAVALLVFGPQQLPEMAKKIAKGLKEVRKASDDLKRSINLDDDEDLTARHRWKPPHAPLAPLEGRSGERPPLMEPPKTQTPATLLAADAASGAGGSDDVPASITGSALAVEAHHVPHVDGDPIIQTASSSVAIGSSLSEETTDPQKPSLKEAG